MEHQQLLPCVAVPAAREQAEMGQAVRGLRQEQTGDGGEPPARSRWLQGLINGLVLLMELMNVPQSNADGIWSCVTTGKLHTALHFQQLSARLDTGDLLGR